MKEALLEAEKAAQIGEIPIGAVVVKDDKIISRAYNTNRSDNDPSAHAEMKAIRKACEIIGNERIPDCTLYVTKEPCSMCSGVIIHSRIKSVFFGAYDKKYGACGTVLSICGNQILNHVPEIIGGILEEECSEKLSSFFRNIREMKKQKA